MTADEIVEAACGWGWDRAGTADAGRAEAMLASDPVRTDFLVACLAGETETVRARLAAEPELARRRLGPRTWEPLLYVSYCVLLARPGARAAGILGVAQLLLDAGADPNARYTSEGDPSYPFPALYASIAVSQNLELTRALLRAGANPNDDQSLYHAAELWDERALDLLHAHGASAKDISYCLFHKLDFAHEPGIRWFLDHGADPNGRHPAAGETPLHWAVKRTCSPAVIELLVARGADPNARTRTGATAYPEILGWTPLDVAERLGRTDVAEVLRRHGGVRGRTEPLDEFVFACARGDADEARRRLAADPTVMERLPAEDRTLIANVAQQNSAAGVELMLALGFDPNVGGWGGCTPLHWAACRGNRSLVRALLARGVPLVDLGPPARTPVHQALHARWNKATGDYVGVLEEFVAARVRLPPHLDPTGDEALDAAVKRLRERGDD